MKSYTTIQMQSLMDIVRISNAKADILYNVSRLHHFSMLTLINTFAVQK